MPIDATLRMLSKARGLDVTDLATAIPRASIRTIEAWLKGEKLPGRDQIEALARTLGVPAGALLAELAQTLDPARTRGEHALLAAYRALSPRQQGALLEVARSMAASGAASGKKRKTRAP
jgi:transcriptional regulator with XRE-family HTH domain